MRKLEIKLLFSIIVFFLASHSNICPAIADETYPTGLREKNEYFIYAPKDLDASRNYPLLVTFSPGGNGRGLIRTWQKHADKYKFVLFASKIVKNGMNVPLYLKRIRKLIKERIATEYPISPTCVITAGTSGGGMAAHLFSFFFPDIIAGVITSVGYVHEKSLEQTEKYPRNKACAFLTSPTDFNYKLMKEDKKYLDSHDWNTLWLEFEGGHRTAPFKVRDKALEWILSQPEITDKLD